MYILNFAFCRALFCFEVHCVGSRAGLRTASRVGRDGGGVSTRHASLQVSCESVYFFFVSQMCFYFLEFFL